MESGDENENSSGKFNYNVESQFISLGYDVFHVLVKTSAQATNYKFKSFIKLGPNFLSSEMLVWKVKCYVHLSSEMLVWKVKCYVHLVRAFLETLSGLHQLR